jgi:hypothetical protein
MPQVSNVVDREGRSLGHRRCGNGLSNRAPRPDSLGYCSLLLRPAGTTVGRSLR